MKIPNPVVLLSIFWVSHSWGWGELGHATIAEIAERRLSEKGKDFVVYYLREPMAVSSTWPDQVRSDDRYKGFAPYHFLEILSGYTFLTLPDAERSDRSADTMLRLGPKIITDINTPVEQRRMLLKLFVHIAGDVHQPLHVGNGVDMGANLCAVWWVGLSGRKYEKNLHTVWDEDIFEYAASDYQKMTDTNSRGKRWFGYRQYADWLDTKMRDEGLEKLAASPLEDWYQESQNLHGQVYYDTKPIQRPEDRTYCKVKNRKTGKIEMGKFDGKTIPTLDETYSRKALSIAEKRIYLAGLRLAHALNAMADKANPPDVSPKELETDIEAVQIRGK